MTATAARSRSKVVLASALTAAVVGAGGLAAMALPVGAGGQPSLPDITAEELVTSALSAHPPALGGTVHVTNALGLPPLPGLPQQALSGATDIRVWFDGQRRSRISLPSGAGEQTYVDDGATLWRWDSPTRTVTKTTRPAGTSAEPPQSQGHAFDPAAMATRLLAVVRPSSTITVDGTANVADRPAYELVLAPLPTERTLVREVRIAIDSQTRIPLRLQLLANGSADPVFSVGFDQLSVGPQDAALFQFTPPEGATVVEKSAKGAKPDQERPEAGLLDTLQPRIVGDGWDMVLVARIPSGAMSGGSRTGGADPRAFLDRLGTPVSGTWGSGHLITTAVASAIVTSDGRVAVGAVPQQVLVEALSQ
jgi:outer membrane lipoprotein-sorting protein